MQSVIANLEQGSEWDSRMLFFGVLLVFTAFISIYDTGIWRATDKIFIPLLALGMCLVILNIVLRVLRPKLKVTVFEIQDDLLKICPIQNLQFSGWVAKEPIMVKITDLSMAKVYDFYSHGNKAGMYWVCLELKNRRVIEFNFDNHQLVNEIIEFIKSMLPSVELTVDERIKS